MTIQAPVPGLTSTTSPLLATTTSAAAQNITSHIQQVPVRVHGSVEKCNQQLSCVIKCWTEQSDGVNTWRSPLRCCCSPSSSRLSLCCWPRWSMTLAWSPPWPLPQLWRPPPRQCRAPPCRWAPRPQWTVLLNLMPCTWRSSIPGKRFEIHCTWFLVLDSSYFFYSLLFGLSTLHSSVLCFDLPLLICCKCELHDASMIVAVDLNVLPPQKRVVSGSAAANLWK